MTMRKDTADNMKRQYKAEEFIKTTEREVRTVMESRLRNGIRKKEGTSGIAPLGHLMTRTTIMAVITILFCCLMAVPRPAEALTSGPNDPSSAAINTSVGTITWTNPGNVYVSDDLNASAVNMGNLKITRYLAVTGFNFAIPPTATIAGIEVSIERRDGGKNSSVAIRDNSIKLVKGGVIGGTDKAITGTDWPATDTPPKAYGSSTDLWGNSWSPADINSASFGVAISAKAISYTGFGSEDALIDNIKITVHYTDVTVCTPAAPTVSITPATPPNQTITTNGGSINYTVSITNNDTGPCTSTSFSLPVSNSNNTDFTVAASLGTVVLAPGANTTVPLPVIAVSGRTTGTTNTSVTATAGGHADGISNTVTTTINVPVCTPAAPTIVCSPNGQTIGINAGTATYTCAITNNDSPACACPTFIVGNNDIIAPLTAFDASGVNPPSVLLCPGASTTVTLTVNAHTGETSGTNNTSVTASDATHTGPLAGTSNIVTTTLNVVPCTPAAPSVSITPSTPPNQTIATNGGSINYTLSITNNDTAACTSTSFSLPVSNSNNTDFTVAASLGTVVLAPGANTTVPLPVTAVSGKTTGTTSTSVTATAGGHADGVSNSVTTTINVTAGNNPASAVNNTSVGTMTWTNPGNVYVSDDLNASAVNMGNLKITNYLVATGFNFAIPGGSTIAGIEVSIERRDGGKNSSVAIRDNSIKLVKGGVIGGTDKAITGTDWPATDTPPKAYGSSTDLWGNSWTPADINSASFGVAVSAKAISYTGFGSEDALIDNIKITIHLGGACVRNVPSMTLAPATGLITTNAGTKPYTLTITNNDTGVCGSETFTLTTNDTGDTVKMSSAVGPTSVSLAVGASTTATVTVTAVSGQTTGSLTTSVTAASANHANKTSDNTVNTTLDVSICVRNIPSVSFSAPTAKTISSNAGTATYSVSITNNDSGNCAAETFTLTTNDTGDTVKMSSAVGPTSVSLAVGASTTATVTVTAVSGQTTGSLTTSVTAASANHANKTSDNTAVTTLNVCTTAAPTLTFPAPTSKTISTNGGNSTYSMTITNNDAVNCLSTTFNLAAVDSNSVDFTTPSTVTTPVTLAPGANTTVTLTVTAASGRTSGVNNTYVNATRQGNGHAAAQSNTVTTTIDASCTRVAPTMNFSAPTSKTIATDGGNVPYTLTITNNDVGCAIETFNLTANDSDTAPGTNFDTPSILSAPSVVLASQATSAPISLTVKAKAGQSSGTNTSSVTAASTNHANKTSNNVTTTLDVAVCTQKTPILIVAPTAQSITPGGSVEYTVKVKNADTGPCGNSTFTLAFSDTDTPDGSFKPSTLLTTPFDLTPGATATRILTVSSENTAANGNFNDTTVSLTVTGHASPANVVVKTTVAPVSPLMHNSINAGTCSNTAYTNPADCVANGGTWTPSSKWAGDGGWGLPGTRYGVFTCATCHTPGETANIKSIKETITAPTGSFPGGAVAFQNLSQFGNDAGGHANSNRICEVCHSQTKYHNYDTANNYAGADRLDHNNNTDCVTCHTHKNAFKASCTSCHGNPPIVDTPGVTDGLTLHEGKTTGSNTAGAHNKHAKLLGYSCNTCHNNSVMPQESTVKPGYWDISIGFNYLSGITSGAYSGQAGVSYNNTLGAGGLTCSAIYCHGSTMAAIVGGNGGTNTSPKWDVPSTGACNTCHGATASIPPKLGSHLKHTKLYFDGGHEYSCTLCHTDAGHVNNKSEVKFSSDPRVSGPGTIYAGGTDAMLDGYGACNVYCHSTVQAHGGTGAPLYSAVAWGGPTLVDKCNACHGGPATHTEVPATGMSTGSHIKHGSSGFKCATCHANDKTKLANECAACHVDPDKPESTHANYVINVNIIDTFGGTYSGSSVPGDGYSTCSSVYCHSSGQNSTGGALAGGDYTNPTWGSTLDCAGCHKNMDSDAAATGSHVKHAQTAGIACATCHNGYTETTTATATHVNKSINLSFSGSGTGTTYSQGNTHAQGNGYGTCSTSSCHSSGQGLDGSGSGITYGNPAWGGTLNCGSCHKDMDTDATANGNHVKHAQTLNYACATCHNGYTETTVAAGTHNNGSINLIFSGTATGTAYSQGNTHLLANGFGTCGTSYCHSNGSGTYKAPTWGAASTGCNFCHDALPTSAAHAKHVTIAATAYGSTSVSTTGGVYNFGCGNCHPKAIANHANGTLDVLLNDGVGGDTLKVLNSPSANKTGTGSTTVCNLTYCHSNGTNTGAAIVAGSSPQWGNSPYSGDSCAMCHGNSPSSGSHQNHVMAGIHFDTIFTGTTGLAAMGNTATGAHGNAATANTISCNVCHNGTVTSAANDKNTSCSTASCHDTAPRLKGNAAIAAGSNLHLNGAKNMALQAGTVRSKAQVRNDDSGNAPAGLTRNVGYKVSGAYDSATINAGDWNSGSKTCTTACHLSQQSPTWGTATTCLSCHTTLPR